MVEYRQFVSDVEQVFARHAMQTTPLIQPEQFKPKPEHTLVQLDAESEARVQATLARVAEQVEISTT